MTSCDGGDCLSRPILGRLLMLRSALVRLIICDVLDTQVVVHTRPSSTETACATACWKHKPMPCLHEDDAMINFSKSNSAISNFVKLVD